jgi:hypothetical protein
MSGNHFAVRVPIHTHVGETLHCQSALAYTCTVGETFRCQGTYTQDVGTTEYTECWPCTLFDILLNKYVPAGYLTDR